MRQLRNDHAAARELAHAAGRTRPPHPRRGGFMYRWCGEGASELRLRLVRPTYIHRDLIQSKGVPTIIDATQR